MDRNQGLIDEPLFVGMTRPAMKFGVTYSGLLLNMVITMEAFIITKDVIWLAAAIPIHLLTYLVCLYEPRFFDLMVLWVRTRGFASLAGNTRFWRANSYSPLRLDLPDHNGRRKDHPRVIL